MTTIAKDKAGSPANPKRLDRPERPGPIRVGVGGWTYAPWRGTFYPSDLTQKEELAFASRHLTSIEINGTFYRAQTAASFAKWHDETPDDFVFAVKAPRFATNRRVLAEVGPSIERFFASGLMGLKDKLGPINWQFSAYKRFEPDDFSAFLGLLPRIYDGRPIRHAVEVRHKSFVDAAFVRLAREHDVAIVVDGDSKFVQIADVTASFIYVRVMRTTSAEANGYAASQLDAWVGRARDWAAGREPEGLARMLAEPANPQPRDVFFYLISGFKERDPLAASALIERLNAQ